MTIFEAIIQGIVQGATEFLPISSSGHLSISQHILGVQLESLFFDIMLHIGTLIAVLFVYHKLIIRLTKEFFVLCGDIFKGKFKWKEMNHDRRLIFMLILGLVPLFLLFLPIPGTELKLKDVSDLWATDTNLLAEGIALLITAALLFLGIRAEKKTKEKNILRNGKEITLKGRKKLHTSDALSIGLAQFFAAMLPGLSRSGSTLCTGLIRGVNKQTALDYSFVLGIPAILAAAVLTVGDAMKSPLDVGAGAVIAGLLTSAITGFLAIKLLKWIVSSNKLHIFAYYTLVVGVIVIIISIIEFSMGINIFSGVAL